MTIIRHLLPGLLLPLTACIFVPVETEHETYRFEVDEFSAADLQGHTGSIEVRAGDEATVEVELQFTEGNRPEVSAHVEGETLTTHYECPPSPGVCAASFLVTLPAETPLAVSNETGQITVQGMAAPLTARNDTGRIEIEDHEGCVDVANDTGSILLRDVSGSTRAASHTGAIEAVDLDATVFHASNDTGSIHAGLIAVPDEVELETDTGSVDLEVPTDAYDLELDSQWGAVVVDNVVDDPDAGRWIDIQTTTGSIQVTGW